MVWLRPQLKFDRVSGCVYNVCLLPGHAWPWRTVQEDIMYAVVSTGGKQYRVSEGDTLTVERLRAGVGERVTLEQVLMVARNDEVFVGKPTVEGARVHATVLAHDRGPKLIIFKYRPKKHYRVKTGHRQEQTKLRIETIEVA